MNADWPTVDLDPVRRLLALAAGIRGAAVTERVIPEPLDRVWAALTDFEGDFTRIITDMPVVQVEDRHQDRVTLLARSRYGLRARLTGPVTDGWCVLQSRFLLVAFAAAADGPRSTRVALTGGVRIPARPALAPIAVRYQAEKSLDRLQAVVAAR